MTGRSDDARRRGEPRLPASVATLLAAALYALLPGTLIVGPRLVIPSLEIALLAVLVAVNPIRMSRSTRSRISVASWRSCASDRPRRSAGPWRLARIDKG